MNRSAGFNSRLFLISSGILLLGLCLYLTYSRYNLVKEFRYTEGTVVAYEKVFFMKPDGSVYVEFSPVVEWRPPFGQKRRFTSLKSSNPPEYDIGTGVMINYSGNTGVGDCEICTFSSIWLMPILSGIAGILFFIAGLAQCFFTEIKFNAGINNSKPRNPGLSRSVMTEKI